MTREEFRKKHGPVADRTFRAVDFASDLRDLVLSERAKAVAEALGPIASWPVVLEFAKAMARKLEHHRPKKGGRDGWASDSSGALLLRLRQEVDELDGALFAEVEPIDVLGEAADVANMAMMVADAYRPLEQITPKGGDR